jgi:hypothetical protein
MFIGVAGFLFALLIVSVDKNSIGFSAFLDSSRCCSYSVELVRSRNLRSWPLPKRAGINGGCVLVVGINGKQSETMVILTFQGSQHPREVVG